MKKLTHTIQAQALISKGVKEGKIQGFKNEGLGGKTYYTTASCISVTKESRDKDSRPDAKKMVCWKRQERIVISFERSGRHSEDYTAADKRKLAFEYCKALRGMGYDVKVSCEAVFLGWRHRNRRESKVVSTWTTVRTGSYKRTWK